MADSPDMITAIEEAVLALLDDKVTQIKSASIQKGSNALLRDLAVAVAVLDGKWRKVSNNTWRNECTVSVLIKFKNMQSEEARRKGINPLVMAATQYLTGQKLGLAIGALQPGSFRDVTTEEKYQGGVIEYLLEFSTNFDIEKLPEEDLGELVTLAVDYLITGGEAVDASDTLTTNV